MVRLCDPPIYCYHEIVHNQLVVDRFRALGVRFVDDLSEVPEGASIMLSAHGSPPEVVSEARRHGGVVVDAVCPLVTKVHHEFKLRAEQGFTVVYVGHDGHDEAVGAMAIAPASARLVQSANDVLTMDAPNTPIAVLTQTTLSEDEWSGVRQSVIDRFGDVWTPGRSDLCFATTNRQAALKRIVHQVDAVVVIGSANSSNTLALVHVAQASGVQVHRVNGPDELPASLTGTIGVTAGASAPDELVAAVISALAPANGVTEVTATDEDEYFPLPRELRDAVHAITTVVAKSLDAPTSQGNDDRTVTASSVLETL